MIKKNFELIRPPTDIINELDKYIRDNNLQLYNKDIDYHFNRGEWSVNLADTKNSMINYDFKDLINDFQANYQKEDGQTNKEYLEKKQEKTEALRSGLLNLYYKFRNYVIEQLTPIVTNMNYEELFSLFDYTWGEAPFKLNYLLEDMFLLFGKKSIMQNVVGSSGSFKSTRSMIEFNSLPSVLLIDDATIAGISRDCQTKGINYLDDTVVYYNDVGDSAQMQSNFKECLQSVYKKLFSEGMVNRTLAMKNSDKTLRLNLRTPNGFKLKFNSVKPIFSEDDGQTAARTMLINLPSYTAEEAEALVRSGRFGNDIWTRQDPRIFKDVFQVYYKTREFKGFDSEFRTVLTHRCNIDNNNDDANFHQIGGIIYKHEEMVKLYGMDLYKEKYFNRVMINTSVPELEWELYNIIREGLGIEPMDTTYPIIFNDLKIAKTKTASAHKDKYNYEAFTVKAVKGIRRNFITNNSARISSLLKSMEENDLCEKVGTTNNNYNVYVLIEQGDAKNV